MIPGPTPHFTYAHIATGESCLDIGFHRYDFSFVFDKSIVIDVRDLLEENSTTTNIAREVKNRMKYVRSRFPLAFRNAKNFSLLTLEDKTGTYELAEVVNFSVILAATEKLTARMVEPSLHLLNRVFFVPVDAVKNLLVGLKSDSSSGLVLDFVEPSPVGVGYEILAFIVLKMLSLTSIVVAGLLVIRNHEELIALAHKMRPDKSAHPFLRILVPGLLLLSSVTVILLAYFFYDVMVYFFIAVFVIAGASAMSYVISTLFFMKAPVLKRIVLRIYKLDVNLVRCVLFLISLAFTTTWCVFRNNYSVGWIMQDIIGVFLVIQVLVDISILLSFKACYIGFAIFVLYDVFFVFITPFLVRPSGMTEVKASGSNAHESLSRDRRSIAAPGDSIMEAVATGSAGTSGELMPLVFKVFVAAITSQCGVCQSGRDHVLLGFGDAVLPDRAPRNWILYFGVASSIVTFPSGALCVFLAFYDGCWKRRIPWNFISSLLGKLLLVVLFTRHFLFNNEIGYLYCICVRISGSLRINKFAMAESIWPTYDPVLNLKRLTHSQHETIVSSVGYVLGGVAVSIVLFTTKMAQPALLYLCPFTLLATIVSAYIRGGVVELRNLWSTNLPTPAPPLSSMNNASGDQSGASDGVDEAPNSTSTVKIDDGYRTVTIDLVGHGASPIEANSRLICCADQKLPIFSNSKSLDVCLQCPRKQELEAFCAFDEHFKDVEEVFDKYVVKYYQVKGSLASDDQKEQKSPIITVVAHSYGYVEISIENPVKLCRYTY
ncbi:unnamed protein product [Hydatigera taeniaeformis]|uniref:Transmembrane 9 superfamily member n=1 Tax=Hydatigena taeniaeformis TaxID=6205 RepID=A0A0R3WIL6_HYDTA|nr:unnamed protein product [Hydatigera taeniaeformis]